jgi:hypothetical protein
VLAPSRRHALCLSLALLLVFPAFPTAPMAWAGGCPDVRSSSPGDPGHVIDRFFDAFFCEIPLREGTTDLDRWGMRHLETRCEEPGGHNHCWGLGARVRSADAIAGPSLKCPLGPRQPHRRAYILNYLEGRQKRHQYVIVDFEDYRGLGPLGIRTSHWRPGHAHRCRQVR